MGKYAFAIDRGGTFTDVYVRRPDGTSRVLKLLSEDENYADAPTEGIRRIFEEELKRPLPRGSPIDASNVEWIRMGTTVATNALLERKGERTALAITKGFRDLLYIGNQSRPKLFDLNIEIPDVLYEEVVEVDERAVTHKNGWFSMQGCKIADCTTEEKIEVWRTVDEQKLGEDLNRIFSKGISSLAVLLIHSYKFPGHEIIVEKIARKIGFKNISLSHQVMPMIKAVPRGFTATADAYLTPMIQKYTKSFLKGFSNMDTDKLLFMQSDGGLAPVDTFYGSRAILSGPAGGVVGVALTAYDPKTRKPVIGFDMGGTSTDVSRYAGEFDHVFETTTAGVTIQAPQLDINTVAAGGGSKLFFRDGLFIVGPDSVGANPGPACYGKGGDLAITDANLILGRILPKYFPKIFGPSEHEPLSVEVAKKKFEKLTQAINEFQNNKSPMSVEEVAMGFIDVANEAMCRPIRALTQAKGFDTSNHILSCFGGAGGQHACAIAKSLGIKTVFIHKYASILSAYGLALADIVYELQEPVNLSYAQENFSLFDDRLNVLSEKCKTKLIRDGFESESIKFEFYLNLRYDRTDCSLMCSPLNLTDKNSANNNKSAAPEHGDFLQSFLESYKREFGFVIPGRTIIVDDIRVRAIGRSSVSENKKTSLDAATAKDPSCVDVVDCYFKPGFCATKIYKFDGLYYGHKIDGPAVILDTNSTIVVEPGCLANITEDGNVLINVSLTPNENLSEDDVDPINLSIFSHRFMSIAEQMGRVLQRTAISTNIKERLDFSCALFSEDGGLVANAPHIPVHLGSMQETVKFQMNHREKDFKEGDVILCNDPNAGGTHLPDLTVITPVYYNNSKKPVFFVANRGHHADIGGLVPGSMPPHSKALNQEGACIMSFKLVDGGQFQEQGIIDILMDPGKVKGCSGTRNLQDNLADLHAQIAANQKGIGLVNELIDAYGLPVVQKYMKHIQANADLTVREMLKHYGSKAKEETGKSSLRFIDHMDDGSPIELKIDINIEKGDAVFNFSGTGHEVYGNTNAPKAVVQAAIIYCLRSLVGREIPLNQGCLKPISVILPQNSIINPSREAAVVGGNVLTSQRLVDVILGAFGACAASQGCMNNVTFGDSTFAYYETVAGGAGAGNGHNGRSGIHTHMTNTRITDVEILEQRYPIVLNQFHLLPDSGGLGKWTGGNGVIREYLFRSPVTLSVLTERRVFSPYGLKSGASGSKGSNIVKFSSGRIVNLGGKSSIPVSPGDIFIMQTPGGGGWGDVHSVSDEEHDLKIHGQQRSLHCRATGSLHNYCQSQESA